MADFAPVVTFVVGLTDDDQFAVGLCTECDVSYRVPAADHDDFLSAIVSHAMFDHGCLRLEVRRFDDDVREAMQCLTDGEAAWLHEAATTEQEN